MATIPDDMLVKIASFMYPSERRTLGLTSKRLRDDVKVAQESWMGTRVPVKKSVALWTDFVGNKVFGEIARYKLDDTKYLQAKKATIIASTFIGSTAYKELYVLMIEIRNATGFKLTLEVALDYDTKKFEYTKVHQDKINDQLFLEEINTFIRYGGFSPYFKDIVKHFRKKYDQLQSGVSWSAVEKKVQSTLGPL